MGFPCSSWVNISQGGHYSELLAPPASVGWVSGPWQGPMRPARIPDSLPLPLDGQETGWLGEKHGFGLGLDRVPLLLVV